MTEQKSLVTKLCEVMALIPRIEKRGRNEFHQYDYAMEADIVDTIRPLLAKRKVFVFPSLLEFNRTEHSDGGKTKHMVDLKMTWIFEDAESGETRKCIFPGSGQDSGDKSTYKAITGSEKYFLLKSFLVATGDDPEKDDTQPQQAPQAPPLPTRPAPTQPPVNPPYEGPPPTAPVNGGQIWQGKLMGVEAKTITSKKTGQPYVIHEFKISLQDGIATAGAGFDEELADRGKLAVGAIIRAQIVPGQKRGFWTIQNFEVIG